MLLFVFGTFSCSLKDAAERKDYNVGSESQNVLLEITVERSQVDFPPGKTLLLRVYSNRIVEFSNYPVTNNSKLRQKSYEIESSQLSNQDFESLVDLIKR